MKIFIACSKYFYDRITEIENKLEGLGHDVMMPNSYEEPFREERMKELSLEDHIKFKQEMMGLHETKIKSVDSLLVLNCQEPPVKDWWHVNATLRVVLEHTQNSTSDLNHSSQTSGILMFKKNNQSNYTGGATFMEIVKTWKLEKKVYIYNSIPDNIFRDELIRINPTIIYGDLKKIK